MGCDIHMRAEVKKGDKWEAVGAEFESSYSSDKGKPTSEPYTGRNYELFAFLAGVRNRFDITPIAEPRGWPGDISKELNDDLKEYWNSDGHSASYFTLEELRAADWEQGIRLGGVVPSDVYEYLRNIKEPPKTYLQGILGPNIVQLDEAEWEKLHWSEKINGTRYYIYMWWEEKMMELCSFFYNNTMPALEKLGEPDHVRIVFCFDN